jgi:hypothetical protein
MFIIVTSKPQEYAADPGAGIRPVETWNYYFYGQHRATFVIGEVVSPDARVTITDAEHPDCVNSVPSKFFGQFDEVAKARAEIEELSHYGRIDARIERVT